MIPACSPSQTLGVAASSASMTPTRPGSMFRRPAFSGSPASDSTPAFSANTDDERQGCDAVGCPHSVSMLGQLRDSAHICHEHPRCFRISRTIKSAIQALAVMLKPRLAGPRKAKPRAPAGFVRCLCQEGNPVPVSTCQMTPGTIPSAAMSAVLSSLGCISASVGASERPILLSAGLE